MVRFLIVIVANTRMLGFPSAATQQYTQGLIRRVGGVERIELRDV